MSFAAGKPLEETRPRPASRLLATLSSVIGMGWIAWVFAWCVAITLTSLSLQDAIAVAIMLLVFVVWIAAAPGLFLWRCGYLLRRRVTVENVCGAVFALTVVTVAAPTLAALALVGAWTGGNWRIAIAVVTGAAILVFPIYCVFCRQVLVHDVVAFEGWRDILSKRIVHVASYVVAWMGVLLFWSAVARPSGASDLSTFIFLQASIVVPLVLGYAFYQIVCRKLGHIESRPRRFMGVRYRY